MAEFDTGQRLEFAFKNAPRSSRGGFGMLGPAMWAMGVPFAGQGLNAHYFMQAIRNGQDPSQFMPWLNGNSNSEGGDSATNPIAGMPQWYQDWYNTQGKHGGVPPVEGLL